MSRLRSVHGGRRDRTIQATDVDALASKYSSCRKGYFSDPFLEPLIDGLRRLGPQKDLSLEKFPIINRGTYVRVRGISDVVDRFLACGGSQIVSLGAGSDTRPFALLPHHPQLLYHELDFAANTTKKIAAIARSPQLATAVGFDSAQSSDTEIHTDRYHLHAVDLRSLKHDTAPLTGMDSSRPTLVISECCLCYLEPEDSDQVLKWTLQNFPQAAVVLYEPIGRDDSFGRTMIQNLAVRGISLPSLQTLPTVEAQVCRLSRLGFSHSHGADMAHVHHSWIDAADQQRISGLEFLDEVEEMDLLFAHYCIVWGSTWDLFTEEWSRGRANDH